VRLDHLALLDHPAPGARLHLLDLDEGLETVKVSPDRSLDLA
jgi:hypothetical protein